MYIQLIFIPELTRTHRSYIHIYVCDAKNIQKPIHCPDKEALTHYLLPLFINGYNAHAL